MTILYLQPVPIKFYCSFMATHTTSQGLGLSRLTKTASETPSLKSSCCQWVYRSYKSAGNFSWIFFLIYGRWKRITNSSLVLSMIGGPISLSLNLHSPCVLLWPQKARNETEPILWNFWAHTLKEVSASAFLFWKSAAKVVKRMALDYWIMRDHVERGSQRVRGPPPWTFQAQRSSLLNAVPWVTSATSCGTEEPPSWSQSTHRTMRNKKLLL